MNAAIPISSFQNSKWGVIPFWPENPAVWVHPDDQIIAEELIPSFRVVERIHCDSEFDMLKYGKKTFRVKPALMIEVTRPPFELEELVQVTGLFGAENPILGYIQEVVWNPRRRFFEFQLRTVSGGQRTKLYRVADLTRISQLNRYAERAKREVRPLDLTRKLVGL